MIRKMMRPNEKGFTLIELMIVVAIIGILMAIAIPNYIQYRTTGANNAAQAEAANFLTAALAHVASSGVSSTFTSSALPDGYPSPADGITLSNGSLQVGTTSDVLTSTITFTATGATSTYRIAADGEVAD